MRTLPLNDVAARLQAWADQATARAATANDPETQERLGKLTDSYAHLAQSVRDAQATMAALLREPRAHKAASAAPRRSSGRVPFTYRDHDDFMPALHRAMERATAEVGRWYIDAEASVSCRLPKAWADFTIYGGTRKGRRDRRIPAARFWPTGELPVGPEYAKPGKLSVWTEILPSNGMGPGIAMNPLWVFQNAAHEESILEYRRFMAEEKRTRCEAFANYDVLMVTARADHGWRTNAVAEAAD